MLLEQLSPLVTLGGVPRVTVSSPSPPVNTENRLVLKGEMGTSAQPCRYYLQKRNPLDTKSHLPSSLQTRSAQSSWAGACTAQPDNLAKREHHPDTYTVGKKQQPACNSLVKEVKNNRGV